MAGARRKYEEELEFWKQKSKREVEKAWEEYDTHWGKMPVHGQVIGRRESDDKMEIDQSLTK